MTATSENLEAALRRALSVVMFDVGRIVAKRPDGTGWTFADRPAETLNPEGLRKMYDRARREGVSLNRTPIPAVRIPEAPRTVLADTLRDFLGEYVEPSTDSVGHAFPMVGDCAGSTATFGSDELYTHPQFSSIEGLANALTRGAAVAGCDRIAALLAGWVKGAPMSYRTCTILPITMAHALSPLAGVDIVPLPLSTAELPAGLPTRPGKSRADYLGQSLVSANAETKPALFRPKPPRPDGQEVRASLMYGLTLETVREALSLECNAFVDGGLTWDDYGEFFPFANRNVGVRGALGHVSYKSLTISQIPRVSTLKLYDEDIREPSEENIGRLLRELQSADARTRVAVSRWKMAMSRIRGLRDRFIDLRIALESLFLQQPNQELKFRLAVSGAWLVGEDAPDRRRVWHTLRRAYDLASTAVHGGDMKKTKNTDSALVLADALAVCRRGILRVLHQGLVADWTDLILDCPDS